MVRKSFNRAGRPIVINSDEAGIVAVEQQPEPERIEYVEVGSASGNTASADNEVANDAGQSDGGSGTEYTDPGTAAERPKRKYTRRSATNSPRQSKVSASVGLITANLEKVLLNMHTMASAMLALPELAIEKDEAKMLADAVQEVAAAYDFTTILSPKTQALVDLSIACATIYGPRVMVIMSAPKKRASPVAVMPQRPQQTQPTKVAEDLTIHEQPLTTVTQ